VGAAAYAAALNDFVAMVGEQSYLFITGPKVTRVVTGEEVELADLGGAQMHAKSTGQCHAVLPDEPAAIAWARTLLGFLRPEVATGDSAERLVPELDAIVPLAERRSYDMRKVVRAVFDEGTPFEVSAAFAPNLLTVLARLGGKAVAVVASQPMVAAGCLDIDASRKGAAFVSWASSRGIPVLTLVDVPGYLPGKKQEQGGILPHGATLIDAYGSAKVPLVCLVVRKSFGGASVLSFAADVRLGLPTARVGPMGADATLEVVLGPEVDGASDEERRARDERRAEWLAAYDHAWSAAEAGYLDRIVMPADARVALYRALRAVERRA
jgi:acetyl-CoA carboxylase carboxyltransferase component